MRQVNNYQTLTQQVMEYKKQKSDGNKRKQERYFNKILQRLCHLINQIVSIITDTEYVGNQEVYKIVLEKMRKLTTSANQDRLRYTCSRIAESQNLTVQDVRQQAILFLLELIETYEPDQDFISYATYLLPRRMTQWLWKHQRCASQQFDTVRFEQLADDREVEVAQPVEEYDLPEQLNVPDFAEENPSLYSNIVRGIAEVRRICEQD